MKRFILIAIVLLTFGCGSSKNPVYEINVHQGSDGITMEFAENSPPEVVYEDQSFPLSFVIENKGAFDVVNGYVSLISEDDYVDIDSWQGMETTTTKLARIDMEGKSKINPEGEKTTVFIKMKAKKLDSMTETHTVFFGLSTCYEYRTYFTGTVCIDGDVYGVKKENKVCTVSDLSSSGQGAPVAVTSVTTSVSTTGENKVKPQFKIIVSNVGGGEIIKQEKIAEVCSSSTINRLDFNEVKVVSATLSDKALECRPATIILHDGIGYTMCELKEEIMATAAYTSMLTVDLSYGYSSQLSGSVEIRRLKS